MLAGVVGHSRPLARVFFPNSVDGLVAAQNKALARHIVGAILGHSPAAERIALPRQALAFAIHRHAAARFHGHRSRGRALAAVQVVRQGIFCGFIGPQRRQLVGNSRLVGVLPHAVHTGFRALVVHTVRAALPAQEHLSLLGGDLRELDHIIVLPHVAVVVFAGLHQLAVIPEFHCDIHRGSGYFEFAITVIAVVIETMVLEHAVGTQRFSSLRRGCAVQPGIGAGAKVAQAAFIAAVAVQKLAGAGVAGGNAHIKMRALVFIAPHAHLLSHARNKLMQLRAILTGSIVHLHIGAGFLTQAEVVVILGDGEVVHCAVPVILGGTDTQLF